MSIRTLCILLGLFAINISSAEPLSIESTDRNLKILFITPKSKQQSYAVNDKSTFDNALNKGWLVPADTSTDILLHIWTNQEDIRITSLYAYFTTDAQNCHFNASTHQISPLFHLKHPIDRQNSQFKSQIKSRLIIAEATIKLPHAKQRYFPCLVHNESKIMPELFARQNNSNIWISIVTTKEFLPLYVVIVFYLVLLSFSALFSGLNLGLMSLDLTELKQLKKIGSLKEKVYAKNIYPLRKQGNYLLCTILIGNVLVNSTSTLILGSYLDGIFAAIGSTAIIVIFGEIIPQAFCSRYGLAVGSATRFITYFFMGLTAVVSWPLSKILSWVLGKEIASTYSREKVRELMTQTKGLEEKEMKLIAGALEFKNKRVMDVMTPIGDVFKLDINNVLDFGTFQEIAYMGYSRIPVYEHADHRENLVGMILIQDLVLNDPADNLPVRAIVDYYNRKVAKCLVTDKINQMFERFRQGESHLAFVYTSLSDDNKEAVGIVTLEDIIEELFQSEIKDEADCKRETRKRKAKEALKGKLKTIENKDYNIFVEKNPEKPLISPQVRKALFNFLSSNVRPFTGDFLHTRVLETILKSSEYLKQKLNLAEDDLYLYKLGEECDYFVLILSGNAYVEIGREKLEVEAGIFSYYGVNALVDDISTAKDVLIKTHRNKAYIPEFSLKIKDDCVFFQMSRKEWIQQVFTSQKKSSAASSSFSS